MAFVIVPPTLVTQEWAGHTIMGQSVIMSLFKLSPSRSLSYLFCVCIHLFAVFSPYWSAHPDPFRPIKRTFQ